MKVLFLGKLNIYLILCSVYHDLKYDKTQRILLLTGKRRPILCGHIFSKIRILTVLIPLILDFTCIRVCSEQSKTSSFPSLFSINL